MTPINTDKKYTILIVEDDVGLQYLIKSKIEDEKYEIITAISGAEAMEQIKKQEVFLMLLDYKLADITGKELLQQVSDENIDVPFIFMTGFGDERIAVEIMKLGAKEYLVKTGEFLNQISTVVTRIVREAIQLRNHPTLFSDFAAVFPICQVCVETQRRPVRAEEQTVRCRQGARS